MALINYGPNIPNLWGQPTQDRSPQMAMQALLQDARIQTARHGMVQRAMKDLNPVTFYSDRKNRLQTQKIMNFEKLVSDISKNRRGRITQEDLLNINYQVKEIQTWQAQAQADLNRFAQEYDIFDKKEGFYKPEVMIAAMHELHQTGNYPVEGGLEVAPSDYPTQMSGLKPFNEEGFTTERQTRVWNGNDWVKKIRTTTEYGLPLEGDPKVIDPVATKRARDRHSMSFLMADQQRMKYAIDGWQALNLRARGGDLEAQTMVAKYNQISADYKINAGGQSHMDATQGKEREYPPQVNPAYLWASREKGSPVIQSSTSSDSEEVEGDTLTKYRLEEAGKYASKETTKLEFVGEGSENKVTGLFTSFSENDDGGMDSLGSTGVTYRPLRTEKVPEIPKDTKLKVRGDTFVLSVPEGGGFYSSDQGTYATDVSKILNHELPIVSAEVDYGVDIYSGPEKIAAKTQSGATVYFKPGQPVGDEQRPLLEQYAKDNQIPLNSIFQESANDFLRVTLQIGSAQGVPGNVTVYQNLKDENAQKILSLRDRGYQPQNRPESEKVVPEAVTEPQKEPKWWQGPRNPFWKPKKATVEEEIKESVVEKNIPVYSVDDLRNGGWTDEQIKQATEAGKIKVN